MDINEVFEQALLAQATYTDGLSTNMPSAALAAKLEADGMTETQAERK